MKGITRLSQKVLAQQPDLQFRCSLVRNTLQLDAIPTEETVKTYAEHLLYLQNLNNSCIESGQRLVAFQELAIQEELHR